MEVTLNLPEPVIARARDLAASNQRDFRDVLADVLVTSLPPSNGTVPPGADLSGLSDQEVLAIADGRLSGTASERLHQLREWQDQRDLTPDEDEEFDRAIDSLAEANGRKALAWVEAVRRGLKPRLD